MRRRGTSQPSADAGPIGRADCAGAAARSQIFRGGVLLLDEVDLILHPLKSELNWPLGLKTPLDLTRGGDVLHGLRWQIPFVLIDAVRGSDAPLPRSLPTG